MLKKTKLKQILPLVSLLSTIRLFRNDGHEETIKIWYGSLYPEASFLTVTRHNHSETQVG